MFGYIRPQKSELLVREYEQYKGIYCSLCRQLGRSYGLASRLTLSYDCTFYAMLLLAMNSDCTGFQSGRCVVNPLKKCTYCKTGENELTAASALSVLMTYYKIKDDIDDSRFWGKLRGYFLLPLASHARRKAARDFSQMDLAVSTAMQQQKAAEESENPGIDFCAEPTANMLQQIFEMAAGANSDQEGTTVRVLRQFGYYLGRWVYLMDAADDLEKDIKLKSFNPFAIRYQLGELATQEEIGKAKENANLALNSTLSQLIAAFNILDLPHFRPIIENVILKGLPEIQKELLFTKEKTNVRSL